MEKNNNNKITKGYKALKKNMTTRHGNMIYELNKEYNLEGDIVPCKNGYHFCKRLIDVYEYYDIKDSRLFEVESHGEVIDLDNKSVTNNIKLVRGISMGEYRKYIEKNLEELVNSENWRIRLEVAKQGYGLDKLIDDKDYEIRLEVVKHRYGLDKLVDDGDWRVRREIASQGYGLDKLVDDEDYEIRIEVAKQGYGLDKLVDDEDYEVRIEVAKQGYGLDKLIDDENYEVRDISREMISKLNKTF